ncbi:hypothetical protein CLIB1444_06S00738 [[Candida] jaroonii]|uniref:Uncharacterized protein n=1 Tax=[Candida] jaroonii TaxID=467808 RepID=A0ACA9Y8M2_9ASCO|nr:hypothetical protein CLIB1444_06S00738 [[Candida] jaroonii]
MSLEDNRLINSPLQQLELQASKAKSLSPDKSSFPNDTELPPSPSPRDRDSIYSFDSVSTNGRLLDRLDLDNEDLFDNEDDEVFHRFNSVSSNNSVDLKQIPITNPNYVARLPSYKLNRSGSKNNTFQIKTVSNNIVYSNRNQSIDSFKADKESLKDPINVRQQSISLPKRRINYKSPEGSPQTSPNTSPRQEKGINPHQTSNESLESSISQQELNDEYDDFNFSSSNDSIENPTTPTRAPSAPIITRSPPKFQFITNRPINRSTSSNSTSSQTSQMSQDSRKTSRRAVSDLTSSPIGKSPSKAIDLTPEARLVLSFQLRSVGKHREASYQLQIAANPPYNDLKAMYYYSMALKVGQGVKQNDKTSLKWLCKSIIIAKTPELKNFYDLRLEELLKVVFKIIENDRIETNPFKLYDYYSTLPPNQVTKIINSVKGQSNVMASIYREVGNYLIGIWGSVREENMGLKALAISASLGDFNSMNQLGEIWSNKSKSRKKDLHSASAWFRLAEIFGIKSIGNSWIYKEKYMKPDK